MSSTEVFYGIKDVFYWLFQNTLEPTGDLFWVAALFLGFIMSGYWMMRQVKYNKEAESNPNQIK